MNDCLIDCFSNTGFLLAWFISAAIGAGLTLVVVSVARRA